MTTADEKRRMARNRKTYELAGPGQLKRDFIYSVDGTRLCRWPTEYDRAFTLRLINGQIERSNELFGYALLQRKYPQLLAERFKRSRSQ